MMYAVSKLLTVISLVALLAVNPVFAAKTAHSKTKSSKPAHSSTAPSRSANNRSAATSDGEVLHAGTTTVLLNQNQSKGAQPLQGILEQAQKYRGAQQAPPAAYRGWLEKSHPEFSLGTSTMAQNKLVVVYGKYDDTGRTLTSLGVPFTTINAGDVDAYDFSKAQVLVVDCPGNLSPSAMMRVRDFVARGGYLFTTDWLLDRLDARIFPGFVSWSGAMNRKNLYDAETYGADPVLLHNTVPKATWKMDIHCHLIRVLNKDAVKILAVSSALAADDPDHQGILAVMFPFERGYVMHMTAHFDRTQGSGYYLPDLAPDLGISLRQAIAINFVVAGLTGKRL